MSNTVLQVGVAVVSVVCFGVGFWLLRESWLKFHDPDPFQHARWTLAVALAMPDLGFGVACLVLATTAPWKM